MYWSYASTLEDIFTDSSQDLFGFADDHTFYDSFTLEDAKMVIEDMQAKLKEVKEWMSANRLKMNDAKTEIIFFGTKQQLSKMEIQEVKVGDDVIKAISTRWLA